MIVGFRIAFGGSEGTTVRFRALRPAGNEVKSLATRTATLDASGVAKVDARIPVEAGDTVGVGGPGGPNADLRCAIGTQAQADTLGGVEEDAAEDATIPDNGIESGYRANVEATVEADADGDGFGDETQDRCASDKTRVDVACATDLALSVALAEPQIPFSTVGVATFLAKNVSAAPAGDVRVSSTLPAGLGLVATTPSTGACGAGIDCTFGTLPAGGQGLVIAVVKGVAPGAHAIAGSVSSPTAETNPADNSASATLTVLPAPLATPLAAPLPRTCRVPKLKGLTRAAAGKALKAAGCRLGRTRSTGGPVRRRVRSQSIPATTVVALDTRVDVVQRGQKRKRKKRRAAG